MPVVTSPAPRPVAAPAPWAEPYFSFGVTGTNGKTSTVWMIAAALRAASLSALRISTLGVDLDGEARPRGKRYTDFLAVLTEAASRGCRHAVIETTSRALGEGYARLWRFDLGVFTNLSVDHFGTHGSWEHYLAAKAQLFMHLGPGRTAVLNAADPHALFLDQAIPADVSAAGSPPPVAARGCAPPISRSPRSSSAPPAPACSWSPRPPPTRSAARSPPA
jgi:UDP-N-acetylmuramoyl-L-alanyl-D-glutamate--2,6-diaminopimelate ligase